MPSKHRPSTNFWLILGSVYVLVIVAKIISLSN